MAGRGMAGKEMKVSDSVHLMEFDPGQTLPPEDRVLMRSGCPPSRRGRFGAEAREAIEHLFRFAVPRALVRTVEVAEITREGIRTEVIDLSSSSLARFMRNAQWLSVFLVTLGAGPEKECRDLQELGQMNRAFFLDSAASCMVDEVSRALQRRLASQTTAFLPNGRFSPGFGDFQLSAQADIMGLLDGKKVGVRMRSDSYMLVPVKSGTGVMGWIRRND
jgi:hypothetical protein